LGMIFIRDKLGNFSCCLPSITAVPKIKQDMGRQKFWTSEVRTWDGELKGDGLVGCL
jgi:hypothetical protein